MRGDGAAIDDGASGGSGPIAGADPSPLEPRRRRVPLAPARAARRGVTPRGGPLGVGPPCRWSNSLDGLDRTHGGSGDDPPPRQVPGRRAATAGDADDDATRSPAHSRSSRRRRISGSTAGSGGVRAARRRRPGPGRAPVRRERHPSRDGFLRRRRRRRRRPAAVVPPRSSCRAVGLQRASPALAALNDAGVRSRGGRGTSSPRPPRARNNKSPQPGFPADFAAA